MIHIYILSHHRLYTLLLVHTLVSGSDPIINLLFVLKNTGCFEAPRSNL